MCIDGQRRRKGFTLLEIMIVILIIVAILGIAWPNWMKARESARTQTCLSNLRQVSTAKEHFAMENKKTTGEPVTMADLVPEFVKEEPTCPSGGEYDPKPVGQKPTCTIASHKLP
ncbi:MAG: prepilin-type N-terminal cleavage/methylation domain-containing protein [Armatimonadetes bacterium]|nr:prepilin-type N-terminal cleavage/methylation domain-containing protein [Armatimonadota bacterium]